jgi:hypothetical protein
MVVSGRRMNLMRAAASDVMDGNTGPDAICAPVSVGWVGGWVGGWVREREREREGAA